MSSLFFFPFCSSCLLLFHSLSAPIYVCMLRDASVLQGVSTKGMGICSLTSLCFIDVIQIRWRSHRRCCVWGSFEETTRICERECKRIISYPFNLFEDMFCINEWFCLWRETHVSRIHDAWFPTTQSLRNHWRLRWYEGKRNRNKSLSLDNQI